MVYTTSMKREKGCCCAQSEGMFPVFRQKGVNQQLSQLLCLCIGLQNFSAT